MTRARRFIAFVALAAGGAGVLVCLAGIVGLWLARARIDGATEQVFAQIDRMFLATGDNVKLFQQRVRAAKITSEEIAQTLKTRTKKK